MGCLCSSERSQNHFGVWRKWQNQFELLRLKESDVAAFYKVFQDIDLKRPNFHELEKVAAYFKLSNNALFMRMLAIFDLNGSNQMNFIQFVFALWNYCSLSARNFLSLVFDMYKTRPGYRCTVEEIFALVKDIYNAKNDGSMEEAFIMQESLHQKLLAIGEPDLDLKALDHFVRLHPTTTYPSHEIQVTIQSKIIGVAFWTEMSRLRERLDGPVIYLIHLQYCFMKMNPDLNEKFVGAVRTPVNFLRAGYDAQFMGRVYKKSGNHEQPQLTLAIPETTRLQIKEKQQAAIISVAKGQRKSWVSPGDEQSGILSPVEKTRRKSDAGDAGPRRRSRDGSIFSDNEEPVGGTSRETGVPGTLSNVSNLSGCPTPATDDLKQTSKLTGSLTSMDISSNSLERVARRRSFDHSFNSSHSPAETTARRNSFDRTLERRSSTGRSQSPSTLRRNSHQGDAADKRLPAGSSGHKQHHHHHHHHRHSRHRDENTEEEGEAGSDSDNEK